MTCLVSEICDIFPDLHFLIVSRPELFLYLYAANRFSNTESHSLTVIFFFKKELYIAFFKNEDIVIVYYFEPLEIADI